MAQTTIQVQGNDIHAEIIGGNFTLLSDTSKVLDVITNSYSNLGTLCEYDLQISNIVGLTRYSILLNGKKTRFSAGGVGSCNLTLTVFDDEGNFDSDIITVTII